jgi:hypothetical protein
LPPIVPPNPESRLALYLLVVVVAVVVVVVAVVVVAPLGMIFPSAAGPQWLYFRSPTLAAGTDMLVDDELLLERHLDWQSCGSNAAVEVSRTTTAMERKY